jgi:hypothetical protein
LPASYPKRVREGSSFKSLLCELKYNNFTVVLQRFNRNIGYRYLCTLFFYNVGIFVIFTVLISLFSRRWRYIYSSGRPLKTLVRQRLNRNVGLPGPSYGYIFLLCWYFLHFSTFCSAFSLVLTECSFVFATVGNHFFPFDRIGYLSFLRVFSDEDMNISMMDFWMRVLFL